MSGAGKSVTMCDLLSQTEGYFAYTVIIEEGLSYGIYTATVEEGGGPGHCQLFVSYFRSLIRMKRITAL